MVARRPPIPLRFFGFACTKMRIFVEFTLCGSNKICFSGDTCEYGVSKVSLHLYVGIMSECRFGRLTALQYSSLAGLDTRF